MDTTNTLTPDNVLTKISLCGGIFILIAKGVKSIEFVFVMLTDKQNFTANF